MQIRAIVMCAIVICRDYPARIVRIRVECTEGLFDLADRLERKSKLLSVVKRLVRQT